MCNEQTYRKMHFLGELSTIFDCKIMLREGDALSLVLFNIFPEKMVRDNPNLKVMTLIAPHTFLAYADGIILLGEQTRC